MRRIRWTRTIVFDGPEDHILNIIKRSWFQKGTQSHKMAFTMEAKCTEYKVETYDTQENTSETSQG